MPYPVSTSSYNNHRHQINKAIGSTGYYYVHSDKLTPQGVGGMNTAIFEQFVVEAKIIRMQYSVRSLHDIH